LSALLQFTDFDYPFGIFKLFLDLCAKFEHFSFLNKVVIATWIGNFCFDQISACKIALIFKICYSGNKI